MWGANNNHGACIWWKKCRMRGGVLGDNQGGLGVLGFLSLGSKLGCYNFLVVGCFCCRWAHRTVRWYTGQVLFTIRCVPRQHARWGLERLTVGTFCPVAAPDSPVLHQRCPVHSDFTAWHLTLHYTLLQSTVGCRLPLLRWLTGLVRWIIAERGLENPRVVGLSAARPGAPDTVRCATGNTLSSLCFKLCWIPNLISFLVYVESYAPEIKDILAN
jgi:hypothetical protein